MEGAPRTSSPNRRPSLVRPGAGGRHVAQVHNGEDRLAENLHAFAIEALDAGDPLVVLITEAHHRSLADRLACEGHPWRDVVDSGRGAFLDVATVLDHVLVGGRPDRARFRALMEDVLERWSALDPPRPVRIYGELVNVLCRSGQIEAAADVEEFWNELARDHQFTLVCAYSRGNLYREVNGSAYRRIRDAHDHFDSGDLRPS